MSPEAAVETISFGTPIGSRCMTCAGDGRASGPAERSDRVEPALGMEPQHDLPRAAGHRLERRAPVARVGECVHIHAGRGRHLLASHIGLDDRLAEDAGVDQQHVDTPLPEPVAEVGVLLALGVQRADEDDHRGPLHAHPASMSPQVR